MLGLKPATTIIEVTTPVCLAPRYGDAPRGLIVKVPAHRAEILLRSGCVKRLERAPDGREVVDMTDDKLFELPAPPPREEPLDRPAVLRLLNFSDAQMAEAQSLGFPAPDHVVFVNKAGEGSASRAPRWRRESIEQWRERILALKVR